MATTDYSLDRGLPASADAERAVLGAILLDNDAYPQAAEFLRAEDFSLDSHRRIYLRMMELAESGRFRHAHRAARATQRDRVRRRRGLRDFADGRAATRQKHSSIRLHRQGQGVAARADSCRVRSH
jgi:replicative DNA helicase